MEFSHQGKNDGHFCHPISPWHMASPRGKCWLSEEKSFRTELQTPSPLSKKHHYMYICTCTRHHTNQLHVLMYMDRTWYQPSLQVLLLQSRYMYWLSKLAWSNDPPLNIYRPNGSMCYHISTKFILMTAQIGSKTLKRAKLCRSQDSKWLVFR